jgi:anti-sigma-K factor RskA
MKDRQQMSEGHDCGGDAAAYLLGALEPAEADAFERHLEGCAICRDEVEALSGVVNALPMAAPQYRAPRRLRRRVMRAIRREPPPATKPARRADPPWRRPRPLLTAAGAAALTAVAALAALGVIGPGAGGVRVIQARMLGVMGSAQLRLAGGQGELIVRHMPPPPPGHVYEVWLKAPHRPPTPTSVLFSVTADGAANVGLPDSLRGIRAVLVTPEPDGGSRVPTHSPVIVAQLS